MSKKTDVKAFHDDLHDIMDGAGTMKDTEIAEAFVAKGWRKQSEWISIAERLPKKSGRYLVYGSFADMPLICGAHYDRYNGFGDDGFTHWMPLPEPPKGDRHEM